MTIITIRYAHFILLKRRRFVLCDGTKYPSIVAKHEQVNVIK